MGAVFLHLQHQGRGVGQLAAVGRLFGDARQFGQGGDIVFPADAITLADIYQAVEDDAIFRMHRTDPESKCPVAVQIAKILAAPLRAAEGALAGSLAKTTIRDVTEAIV